jgi:hypothetical protein
MPKTRVGQGTAKKTTAKKAARKVAARTATKKVAKAAAESTTRAAAKAPANKAAKQTAARKTAARVANTPARKPVAPAANSAPVAPPLDLRTALVADVRGFNHWRKAHLDVPIDLRGADQFLVAIGEGIGYTQPELQSMMPTGRINLEAITIVAPASDWARRVYFALMCGLASCSASVQPTQLQVLGHFGAQFGLCDRAMARVIGEELGVELTVDD